jgi:transcriptional regulator with XRE-family HTH domain
MNSWLLQSIGFVLLARRKANNLSLSEVAQRAGISVRDLAALERGARDAELTTLNSLGGVFGVSLEAIFLEAYTRDPERILLCSSLFDDVQSLRKPHRDVVNVTAEKLAGAMRRWRADLLIVDAEYTDYIDVPNSGYPGKPRTSMIILGASSAAFDVDTFATISRLNDPQDVPKNADSLLLQLAKGRIASLRRMQDDLKLRREKMQLQRASIAQKQVALHDKMEALVKRQIELAGELNNSAVDQRKSIIHLYSKLRKFKTILEVAADKLNKQERDITDASEFERHRHLFLKRSELAAINDREQR